MQSRYPVKVSVIMGIYRQEDMNQLKQAVFSILNQSMKELEFIIYQDGIEKETETVLKIIAENDSRVVLLGEKENHGLAYALNCCMEKVRGEYIARMDADDIAKHDRLRIQLDFMEEHPEYAFTGCNAELIDEHGIWGKRRMPEEPEKKDYLPYSPYIHPTVMFRKKVLIECGGYHYSKATLRCEDYDLFMRLYISGKKGYNIQQNLFQYREDRSGYRKRKYRYRVDECHLRYHGFKKMGIYGIKGILYTLKPLLVGLVPIFFVERGKQLRCRLEALNENEAEVI